MIINMICSYYLRQMNRLILVRALNEEKGMIKFMKRILSFTLAGVMIISLAACGKKMVCSVDGCQEEGVEDGTYAEPYCEQHLRDKKTTDAFGETYNSINAAYEIIEDFGEDIYAAWSMGIEDGGTGFGFSDLAQTVNLTEDELKTGFAYAANEEIWHTMTDEEQKEEINSAEEKFELLLSQSDDVSAFCVQTISYAYEMAGKTTAVWESLDTVNTQMEEIRENHSDNGYYPALNGYYTAAVSFFEFCQNPSASLDQIQESVVNYRNNARYYKKDLEYIFED